MGKFKKAKDVLMHIPARFWVAMVNIDPRITNSEFAAFLHEFVVMRSCFLLIENVKFY